MTLRGPADADAFRTTIYGARWYHDPLPTCAVAPATDDKWPAISTVKKAWHREFTKRHTDGNVYPLDPLRVALYVDAEIDTLATMPSDVRVPLMAGAAKRDLQRAGNRGTDVHTLVENLCDGQDMLAGLAGAATEYGDICRRMVDELAPDVLYAETVMFARTIGVAGTCDCIARIAGKTYMIDWKSRAAESNHGAYDNEAAQLGAYASADYPVAEVDGKAQRVLLPPLDGLLVVSIRPDSYEVFPIDTDMAAVGAIAMVETWAHKRAGESAARKACGKPIVLAPIAPVELEPPVDRTAWVQQRLAALKGNPEAVAAVRALWPAVDDQPVPAKPPWTDAQVDALIATLDEAESAVRASFPTHRDPSLVPPAAEPAPAVDAPSKVPDWPADTTPDVDPATAETLAVAIAELAPDHKRTVQKWVLEATTDGRPWPVTLTGATAEGAPLPARNYAIATAAIAWAPIGPDLLRAAIVEIKGTPLEPKWRTGTCLGALTTDEARLLVTIADAANTDPTVLTDLTQHTNTPTGDTPNV